MFLGVDWILLKARVQVVKCYRHLLIGDSMINQSFSFCLLQQGFVEFYSRKDRSTNDDNPWVKYGVLGAVGVVVLGALMTQRT